MSANLFAQLHRLRDAKQGVQAEIDNLMLQINHIMTHVNALKAEISDLDGQEKDIRTELIELAKQNNNSYGFKKLGSISLYEREFVDINPELVKKSLYGNPLYQHIWKIDVNKKVLTETLKANGQTVQGVSSRKELISTIHLADLSQDDEEEEV